MNSWLSRDFLDCLGWTLLHFLWQGLVIAALLAVTLRLLRRRSANFRYLAGCGALLLMAVAPVASFYSLAQSDEAPALNFIIKKSDVTYSAAEFAPPSVASGQTPAVALKPPIDSPTLPERLEALLPWFVAAWSLGVLVLSCRLFAGWLLIQRLRRTATTALTGPWQAKLLELAGRVGVSRPLRLLQSAWVEVPTVIGWLRPVILLPASCLTGLTPAQLESILAHELAHIRRHDYLVNILQNLVETLLFYHPAVWWVSRRIRAEREHCCDDLAVKICGDAIEYARALATLEELRPAPAQLVLAAGGAPLLERIRRLAGQPERSAIRPAWPVAGIVAVLLLALLAAGLRNNPASAQSATEAVVTNQSANVPVPTNVITPSNHASFTTELKRLPSPTNGLVRFGVSGGPRTNPAGPGAIPSGNRGTFATKLKLKQLPPQTNAAAQTGDAPVPQINLKTRFAAIDVSKVGTDGFAWLFTVDEMGNFTNQPVKFGFSEYYAVQPTNLAEPYYYVFLHTNFYAAPLSVTLSEEQNHLMVKKLEQLDGVDLLTAPEVTTEMGRQAQVQAVDINTLVMGGLAKGNTNGLSVVTNLPFGPMVDFIPRLAADGHTIELTMIGTVSEFLGYEDPASVTDKAGRPMPKNWAIPHFRNRQFTATVLVGNAQTLVLASGPAPIATISRTNKKVPLLGDIPLLGRAFRSTKTATNTVRQNLMLLVTPTLINPDGTRYDFPEERHKGQTNGSGNASSHPKLVYTGKGRQAILAKLNSIRIPEIEYDHLPLGEVVNKLSSLVKSLDPEKTGLNFFVSRDSVTAAGVPAAPGTIDPATGLPVAPLPTDSGTDIGSATITIGPALTNISLADALDAVTRCADMPIKYSVLDYAIVFSPRGPEPIPLETRTFHLDLGNFHRALGNIGGPANKSPVPTGSDPNDFSYGEQTSVSVRNFFNTLGVDFDTNDPASVGKAFAWNNRKGMLTVRATQSDLDKISTAIVTRDLGARQINFKVKVVEFDTGTNDNLIGTIWRDKDAISSNAPSNTTLSTISGILTGSQYSAALQALSQHKNARFRDAPEAITISGRPAHIELVPQNPSHPGSSNNFVDVPRGVNSPIVHQQIPVQPDIQSPPFHSVVLDITPRLSEDEYFLELSLVSSIPEFVGYDEGPPTSLPKGKYRKSANSNSLQSTTDMEGNPLPMTFPHFRLPQLTSAFTVLDGQTVLIAGQLNDLPPENTGATGKTKKAAAPVRKTLMIYITPTIINPDGTPLHTEKERSLELEKTHSQVATSPSASGLPAK